MPKYVDIRVLTSGMFTSGLKVRSSVTTSVCPFAAAMTKAVSSFSPLALISKFRTWICTWVRLPFLAAMWSALLFGIFAIEKSINQSINQWHTEWNWLEKNDTLKNIANATTDEAKSNRYLLERLREKRISNVWCFFFFALMEIYVNETNSTEDNTNDEWGTGNLHNYMEQKVCYSSQRTKDVS